MAAFLVVALRWTGVERTVAVALYLFRLVGFAAFEISGERMLLLVFPNVFELWFLLVAIVHRFGPDLRWSGLRIAAALVALTTLKELQEWALHGARLFDGISSLDFLDAVGRWLSGAG